MYSSHARITFQFLALRFYSSRTKSSKPICHDIVSDGKPGAGNIKLSVLKVRYRFLLEHNMLQDRTRTLIGMEHTTNGRTVFRNRHLYDPLQKDRYGKTNIERMLAQKSPCDIKKRAPLVIHHFDQKHTGAWVVLEEKFHTKFSAQLHSFTKPKDCVDRNQFDKQRAKFWYNEGLEFVSDKRIAGKLNKAPRYRM